MSCKWLYYGFQLNLSKEDELLWFFRKLRQQIGVTNKTVAYTIVVYSLYSIGLLDRYFL